MQWFSLIAAYHLEVVGHYACSRLCFDVLDAECQKGKRA